MSQKGKFVISRGFKMLQSTMGFIEIISILNKKRLKIYEYLCDLTQAECENKTITGEMDVRKRQKHRI